MTEAEEVEDRRVTRVEFRRLVKQVRFLMIIGFVLMLGGVIGGVTMVTLNQRDQAETRRIADCRTNLRFKDAYLFFETRTLENPDLTPESRDAAIQFYDDAIARLDLADCGDVHLRPIPLKGSTR